MKIARISVLFLITLTFLLVAGVQDAWADSCRNVKFTARNDRTHLIVVKKVKFFNADENRWQEEDIWNHDIYPGVVSTFGRDDLRDSGGKRITQIKFVFEDTRDNTTRESEVYRPTSPRCVDEKNFGLGQGWAITTNTRLIATDTILNSDKCRNVSFVFYNGLNREIEASKLKFFNRNAGEWETINVANIHFEPGLPRTVEWSDGQLLDGLDGKNYIDLPNAKNKDVTKIILIYRIQDGNGWGDELESQIFEPDSPRCSEGKRFGLGQEWTIRGGTAANDPTLSDACKNVSFSVINGRARDITVVKVKYFNAEKNKWQTEDVPNVTCAPNQVCPFGSENLAGVENVRLTKIVVVFNDQGSNTDQASPIFIPDSPVCRADKQYGYRQGWAILPGATSGFGFEDVPTGACRNVSFTFKNSRSNTIEIRKVTYYNRNENRWQTENVPNTSCRPLETCTFGREDLRDSGGDDITKLKFVFHDTSTKEDFESAELRPSSPKCTDDKVFGLGQGWTTTGARMTGRSWDTVTFDDVITAPARIDPVGAVNNMNLGGDCKGVTFEITNGLSRWVRFKSVEYFNRSSGKWKTERIGGGSRDNICQPGTECSIWDRNMTVGSLGMGEDNAGSNLTSALGDDITKVKFVYQTAGSDSGPWSRDVTSKVFEPIPSKCVQGKVYGDGQNWTLGEGRN